MKDKLSLSGGGAGLAFVAGYVNIVLLAFYHIPVSHMTGAATRFSFNVVAKDWADLIMITSVIGVFFLGAVCSGVFLGNNRLRSGSPYGIIMIVEGICLLVATCCLLLGKIVMGILLAGFACGLQNAMASTYRGLILRTTHVSGLVTDIGMLLGHSIRHRNIQNWKLFLLSALLAGYVIGGIFGGVGYYLLETQALFIPAGIMIGAGTWYYLCCGEDGRKLF